MLAKFLIPSYVVCTRYIYEHGCTHSFLCLNNWHFCNREVASRFRFRFTAWLVLQWHLYRIAKHSTGPRPVLCLSIIFWICLNCLEESMYSKETGWSTKRNAPDDDSFACECTEDEKRQVVEVELKAGHNCSSGCAGCGKRCCPSCGWHLCTDWDEDLLELV